MDYLDKKTMIHVAAELVIVIGIAFWLNSKINAKDEKIEALEKQVKELTARLEGIENFLKARFGAPPPPPQPKSTKTKSSPKTQHQATTSEDEEVLSEGDEEIEI